MDLTTATPVEIDTALAAIYGEIYAARANTARRWNQVEHYVHQYLGLRWDVKVTSEQVRDVLAELSEEADPLLTTGARVWMAFTEYETAADQVNELLLSTQPYDEEYASRPWSRFFLVQNNGGHIHSSMHCSTCFDTTQFGWLPNLSSLTEAEAVAAHGAILCTVCYPTAPTEYTNRVDLSKCQASPLDYTSNRKGYAYGNSGTCNVCGYHGAVSQRGYGKLRKHDPAKA